jgi:hypothetical protein
LYTAIFWTADEEMMVRARKSVELLLPIFRGSVGCSATAAIELHNEHGGALIQHWFGWQLFESRHSVFSYFCSEGL